MILNNFYSLLFLLMLALSIFSFTVLFALFIYKDLGGVKFARDSFLFFDYIFFSSDMRANASALSVICVFIFGLAFDHNRNPLVKNYLVDIVWFLGVVLFFIHCRFFSNLEYGKTKIIFVRELFQPKNKTKVNIFMVVTIIIHHIDIKSFLSLICC